jgi:adenine phosphoribosyltransferase
MHWKFKLKSFQRRQKVLIIDDVVATDGNLLAAAELLRQVKVVIAGALSLLEIADLAGNSRLSKNGISSYSILYV